MRRQIVTNETELRRIILQVMSRVQTLDEFYRLIVRIAIVDLDDLHRLLTSKR